MQLIWKEEKGVNILAIDNLTFSINYLGDGCDNS